ncbi:MAG: 3-deoxy-8-phosphooctulonate synthase [Bacteroidota bacterium]|nr:3-deoxy-8-phosphooctulonate synthase [Chlorobiota bacterium]MDW8074467.1 3-deoxy-8-phosphooctulonate synthase [Bacteroidota bacterium]MDW8271057.1 3-deoxy-8-phosphooctulonate synthase [Bacteroidota bacterium]
MLVLPILQFIAGPCVVESEAITYTVAERLALIRERMGISLLFKSSYRKANRTSIRSFTGLPMDVALRILAGVRERFNLPVLTDVHESWEVPHVAAVVDAIQIPAFLCRQTDLLLAAGKSGKTVNIKKGQFAAPEDMIKAVEKVRSTGNNHVLVTERGTTFGYHDLVVDMRSLIRMRATGARVFYDATHSLQQPSIGETSGGLRSMIPPLARAAVAIGVDGIFFETHPQPEKALSDAATQIPLDYAERFIEQLLEIDELVRSKGWYNEEIS